MNTDPEDFDIETIPFYKPKSHTPTDEEVAVIALAIAQLSTELTNSPWHIAARLESINQNS